MKLGIHEAADLHELMMLKNNCVAKSSMMINMVQDDELRNLLQQDIENGKKAVQQIQGFLSSSNFVY